MRYARATFLLTTLGLLVALAVPSGAQAQTARSRLGLEALPLTPELAVHFGVPGGLLISRVLPGTPAARAGLTAGDILVGADGEPLRDRGDLRRSVRLARAHAVRFDVLRDGKPRVVEVADLRVEAPLHSHHRLEIHGDSGDQDGQIFLSIDGDEMAVDLQELADDLSDLGDSLGDDIGDEIDRAFERGDWSCRHHHHACRLRFDHGDVEVVDVGPLVKASVGASLAAAAHVLDALGNGLDLDVDIDDSDANTRVQIGLERIHDRLEAAGERLRREADGRH